jgi:hypothetical protein
MHALVAPILLRVPGFDPFDVDPQPQPLTASLLSPQIACAEANGTPLSVRITCGSPNSLKVRSKTVKANFSCVVNRASHVSR